MNPIGDDARANTQQVVNEIKKFGDLFEKAIELHLCSVLRIKSLSEYTACKYLMFRLMSISIQFINGTNNRTPNRNRTAFTSVYIIRVIFDAEHTKPYQILKLIKNKTEKKGLKLLLTYIS